MTKEHTIVTFIGKPLAKRLSTYKQYEPNLSCCGPYKVNQLATNEEYSFYLDSDFALSLRWQYCDEIAPRTIKHTGWFTDEYGDSDTIRGIALRLPHNIGFLAGWTMGEGMASALDRTYIYEDEISAALAADSMAEYTAEREREYQAQQEIEEA